ncbi:52 kDa repressor of the inhibitor of the protein kinase-like, partial [Aphis craccivora]
YAPHAVHCPCSNHSLNLSISKSSSVQAIRNSVGLMKEVISFFNMSSKRNYVLIAVLKGKARLKSLCETRWVDRHDSVIIFKSSLPYILEALTAISSWQENDSSSKARTLLTAICTCEFMVSIYSLASLLCVTISVSRILQSVNADISNSTKVINDVIDNLEKKRKNSTDEFKSLFEECKNEMNKLEIDIKKPRIVSRQNSRCNYSTNSVEDYYRISIYIPLLDSVLDDLKCRFLNEKSQALLKLSQVIPRNIVETDDEDVYNLLKLVIKYFTFDENNEINETELKSELNLWKSKWIREKNEELSNILNLDAMTSFELCSEMLYPNIKKLLHIIACLPISVASAERSFSTLRSCYIFIDCCCCRLKTWLRSKMGQDRLCGLALLHIHREIDISIDDIIKRFASLKKRNTDLIL